MAIIYGYLWESKVFPADIRRKGSLMIGEIRAQRVDPFDFLYSYKNSVAERFLKLIRVNPRYLSPLICGREKLFPQMIAEKAR